MTAWEFTVAFETEGDSDKEAQRIVEAVLLRVCGGRRWKHKPPFRWLERWLNICPRSFFGFGPYRVREDGTLENGKEPQLWGKLPRQPMFLSWWQTPSSGSVNSPITWTLSNDSTAGDGS